MSTLRELIKEHTKGYTLYRRDGVNTINYGSLSIDLLLMEDPHPIYGYGSSSRKNILRFEWQCTTGEDGWYGEKIFYPSTMPYNWGLLELGKIQFHMMREIFKVLDGSEYYEGFRLSQIEPEALIETIDGLGYTRYVNDDRVGHLVPWDELKPGAFETWAEGVAPFEGENNPAKFTVLATSEGDARYLIQREWPQHFHNSVSDSRAYADWMEAGKPVWNLTQRYYRGNGWGSFQPPPFYTTAPVSVMLDAGNLQFRP